MPGKLRPRVDPNLAEEWRYRIDEKGDTYKGMASKIGYDVRTIRKYVDLARRERNAKEAAAMVWRGAIESHYRDLCKLVERIEDEVKSESRIIGEMTEPYLWKGLKQHLPRNPLWKQMDRWNSLLNETDVLQSKALKKIERMVKKDSKKDNILSKDSGSSGTAAFLQHQLRQWSRGGPELDIDSCFVVEKREGDLITGRFGAFHFGEFPKSYLDKIKSKLRSYEKVIKSWSELKDIRQLRDELKATREKISDEVAIIRYRRVIAGHCIYCPQ